MNAERTLLEHNEWTEVERQLINQLIQQNAQSGAKWQFIEGSRKSYEGQGRDSFRDVLLKERLQAA